MTASKGTVFSYVGKKPKEMIYVEGLPRPWTEGKGIYLELEETKKLIDTLQNALNEKNGVIFK